MKYSNMSSIVVVDAIILFLLLGINDAEYSNIAVPTFGLTLRVFQQ